MHHARCVVSAKLAFSLYKEAVQLGHYRCRTTFSLFTFLSHDKLLTDEALDEEGDGDDVEDKEVEDVLSVLLEESDPAVPSLPPPVVAPLVEGIHSETGHSVNGVRVVKMVE